MEIRAITPQDYPKLVSWWRLHNWEPVPPEYLPQIGLIVETPQVGVCAGFLYNTDSAIAWLEWVVANPLCDRLVRDQGLDLLIKSLLEKAKDLKKSIILTTVTHQKLAARYVKLGATVTDDKASNLLWRVK